MTEFDFSVDVDRRGTNSIKWSLFGEDVLPMWVADMEFGAPPAVMEALRERVNHPVFGYQEDSPSLRRAIADRMMKKYGWEVDADWVVTLPGLVIGLNLVAQVVGQPGTDVIVNPPIYPPFFYATENFGRRVRNAPLRLETRDHLLHYHLDVDALSAALTPETRMLLFCNPHNPTGRVFSRSELETVAAFCETHDLILCSDEIHAELLYSGSQHIPIASLSASIAERTITLIAPSKTFNVPGLGSAAAIIPNAALRGRLRESKYHFGAIPNVLGFVAAEAAFRDGDAWLAALLQHLESNRDLLVSFVRDLLPGVRVTRPEGTYLAWLDFRDVGLDAPGRFFLEQAKVALNEGATFGDGGSGFARLNFGCSRSMLLSALEKMRDALAAR